jgi:hypothetical protein
VLGVLPAPHCINTIREDSFLTSASPRRSLQDEDMSMGDEAEFTICDYWIERTINRLKQFRRVATRYEKRGVHYLAVLLIASILLWLR